jgi:tetratricopeptide (TPR) repeat protein
MGHPAAFGVEKQRTFKISNADFMVQEILTPQDRPIRLRLAEWASLRLRDLARLQKQTRYDQPDICGAIVDCYNEAALIEVYYGRLDYAAELCNAAMKWVADVVRASGNSACYRFAVQPYVNLGRLDRIGKRWQESLQKFQVAEQVSLGNPVSFGPITIDRESLGKMEQCFPDTTILQNIFILDTLKTLLKATWYKKVLGYFPNWENYPTSVRKDFIYESFLVALGGLGEYDQASELSGRCLRDNAGRNRLVLLYRRAEIFAAAGKLEEAMRIVRNLFIAFNSYPGELTQNKLTVLAALCRMMIRCGFSEVESLLQSGAAAASKLQDVLLLRNFLQMLAEVSCGREKHEIEGRLGAITSSSLYNAARKAGSEGADTIHQLSSQLLSFADYQAASVVANR